MLPEAYLPLNRRRSLEELLALGMPQPPTPLPTARPMSTPPIAPAPESTLPLPAPRVLMGERTEGLSPLGRKLAELRALGRAHPSSQVRDIGDAIEIQPPMTGGEIGSGRNRLKQALGTALYGAAIAAQGPTEGAAARALGGAVTGGAAGAVSPRLAMEFRRHQDITRARGEAGAEQEIALGQARIAETQAEAAQRAAQPELEALRIERQIERDRTLAADRTTRTQQAEEANRIRRETLEERITARKSKAATATEEITVAGRKFKVTPSTAARILEARTKKPSERTEAQVEAELEHEAGMDHLTKRRQADEQASALRRKRAEVVASRATTARGKKEFEASKKQQIEEIDRQITEAERESAYRQKEADDSFSRRNKAKAKAGATAPTGGTVREETIRERALEKGLDPDVAVQRARARGLLK